MSPPWMPLYIKEAVSGTWGLGAAETGAFFLLLMYRHEHGAIPIDDKALAAICRTTPRSWRQMREVVLRLFAPSWCGRSVADETVGIGRADCRPAIPTDVRTAVFARDGRCCVYCSDVSGPFDLDHRLPWSRGGRHTVDNLTVACQSCNRSKGALTVEEFSGVRRLQS